MQSKAITIQAESLDLLRQTMLRYERLMEGISNRKCTHQADTHTTPVIYYPNHPVYDLDNGHDPLTRVGDNTDPKQGKLDND